MGAGEHFHHLGLGDDSGDGERQASATGDSDTGERAALLPRPVRNLLAGAVAVLLVATAAGLAILWPRGDGPDLSALIGDPDELVNGTVTSTTPAPCSGPPGPDGGPPLRPEDCKILHVRVDTGGESRTVDLDWTAGAGSPDVDAGDRIVLGFAPDVPEPELQYYFVDFQRRSPMLWLGALFVLAVVALGRVKGLRALLALAVSLVVLVKFVLPAILDGHSPVAVAITGSAVILVVALYLSHGVNVRTTTAVLGTLVSLLITGALAVVFVGATRLTGLGSEEATFLQAFASSVNVEGLLLGGIIIGSLGVLDDVTVTQASAVWELHRANPALGARGLYGSALRIGRDHIASTVNTLVLAYAGASLPVMIFFTESSRHLGDVLTSETLAVEIVRTLVGSIGLVASVPITTALTAVVVTAGQRQLRSE